MKVNNFLFFFDNDKLIKYITYFIYLIINSLFLFKYGIRLGLVTLSYLFLFYILFHLFFFFKTNFFFSHIKSGAKNNNWFILIGGILYFVLCHLIDDPYQLKIDRWQTIEYSLDYWLDGKYIYDTKNFMGNTPSYLPGQLLFLLIFRFLGNVGYSQLFCLFLFYFSVFKQFRNSKIRFLGIFLMTTSLPYIYDAVCKSDFISSFIIVSSFLILWNKKFENNYFEKPIILGLLVGFISVTRSVTIIPLILFLIKPFLVTSLQNKIKFMILFLLTIGLLMFSVLYPAKDFNYIVKYNPLKMQGQISPYAMVFFLIITIFLSFYIKNIKHVFFASSIIIFSMMTLHLIEQALRGSSYNFFNITYLAAALPFCIISFCFASVSSFDKN